MIFELQFSDNFYFYFYKLQFSENQKQITPNQTQILLVFCFFCF